MPQFLQIPSLTGAWTGPAGRCDLLELTGQTVDGPATQVTADTAAAAAAALGLTAVPAPPAKPATLSKLTIRRRLRAANLEAQFDAALAANPTAQADWNDATQISTADPTFVQVLPALQAALGITAEAMAQILRPGNAVP